MACELLPAVDKQILLFERWLHEHLADVADRPEDINQHSVHGTDAPL